MLDDRDDSEPYAYSQLYFDWAWGEDAAEYTRDAEPDFDPVRDAEWHTESRSFPSDPYGG